MRVWGFAALSALLLAGCGGDTEDFTVEIRRPPAAVYAPLLAVDVREARIAFPGIAFQSSRPADGEILYTIPGSGSFPATIRLKLEARDGGAATLVHTFVKAPQVHLALGNKEVVLNESKVERELQTLLNATGRSLELGSDARTGTRELSTLLFALAVATNEKQMARLLDYRNHPEKLAQLLRAFSSSDDPPTPGVNGSTIRTVDPDAAQRQRELARTEAEWRQEDALNRATAPTTNVELSSSGNHDD